MPRQTLFKPPHPQTEPWPPLSRGEGALSTERARDVFNAACFQLGTALEFAGFKYYKRRHRCVRHAHRFTNEIIFQSSHFNVSGRHVQLSMHAMVASTELAEWRAQHLPQDLASTHVAGGMVHLLNPKYAMLQWELADPDDREATIQDALDFICCNVLPYFERFEDIDTLIANLAVEAVPEFDLLSSVEFSYCFGGFSQAQATLDRFIRDRPDLYAAILSEQSNPSRSTLTQPNEYVQQVVFLRHHYGLQ